MQQVTIEEVQKWSTSGMDVSGKSKGPENRNSNNNNEACESPTITDIKWHIKQWTREAE